MIERANAFCEPLVWLVDVLVIDVKQNDKLTACQAVELGLHEIYVESTTSAKPSLGVNLSQFVWKKIFKFYNPKLKKYGQSKLECPSALR